MSKPPTKLPVNRNKPVGRSISAADVAKLVASAGARAEPGGKPSQVRHKDRPQAKPTAGRPRGGT